LSNKKEVNMRHESWQSHRWIILV